MNASLSPDIVVADVERSARFFREALGFEEVDRVKGPDGLVFSMLARDGFRIMLEAAATLDAAGRRRFETEKAVPRATITLYMAVPDVAAEQRRLAAAGVAFEGPVTRPYGMKEVSFHDGDGYAWTLGEKVD